MIKSNPSELHGKQLQTPPCLFQPLLTHSSLTELALAAFSFPDSLPLLSLEIGLHTALYSENFISSFHIERLLQANQTRGKAVYRGRWGLFCTSHLDVRELLLDQEADLIPVIPWVIEAAAGWFSISPSSARLLVISSHGLGNIPVGNKSVCGKIKQGTWGCRFLRALPTPLWCLWASKTAKNKRAREFARRSFSPLNTQDMERNRAVRKHMSRMPLHMDGKQWAHEYPKHAHNCAAMRTENKHTELRSLGHFTLKYSIIKKGIYFVGHNCTIMKHNFKDFILKRCLAKISMGNSTSLCSSEGSNLPNQQIWL